MLFYLKIVNKMRRVSITISEFTHCIKQPCKRCDIHFICQSTALFKFGLICIEQCENLSSKPARCLNHSLKRLEAARKKFH